MDSRLSPRSAVLHLAPPVANHESLRLVDVEGELGWSDVHRWRGLLRGVIQDGATGLAVDLRGCRVIDSHCLSMLEAAAETLGARGGGVTLVVFPGSGLSRRLRMFAASALPTYDTASAALLALGGRE
jgi:anti-anti-sigma regulatory factor